MTLVLIGFMGSGKSTVARAVNKLFGLTLVEMDDLVCQKTQSQTMLEVFAKGGERLLRETELAIAKEYVSTPNLVVSTGGGVVLSPTILDDFKATGARVIFLRASFELIVQRLEGDQSRPLLSNAQQLYAARLPLYMRHADVIIDVDAKSAEQIAVEIIDGL